MEATARAKSARVLSAALAGFSLIGLGAAWHLETPQFIAPMALGAAGYGVCHFLVRKGWFVVGMLGAVTLLLGQQVALDSTGLALAATPCWGPLILVIAAASLPLCWLSTALGFTLVTHGVLASFDNNLARTWPEYALGAALSATAFGIAWYRANDTRHSPDDAPSSAHSLSATPSESDEQRRLIADHVDDLIALLDAQAKPVLLSPSHARVFGQPLEELMLASVDQWVIPEHREEFRGAIADALKTGRSNVELSLCGPNGITRIFDMKLKRVEGATHSWLASASR
ncbi:MAG: PAS domain S-box protein, partial [Myxococcales bacterium]